MILEPGFNTFFDPKTPQNTGFWLKKAQKPPKRVKKRAQKGLKMGSNRPKMTPKRGQNDAKMILK